jgi:aminodeoxyfutalosine deaminase
MSKELRLFEAAAAVDAAGWEARPGAVLVELDRAAGRESPEIRLLASGTPEAVHRHPAAAAARNTHLHNAVLLPGLVNAHSHLDLTNLGPRPFDRARGFVGWIDMVRRARLEMGDAVRSSCDEGIRRSLLGGVIGVGDIAGNARREPLDALRASPLIGVSFAEFFGLGARQAASAAAMEQLVGGPGAPALDAAGVRLGLQPHAPYSAGLDLYRAATRLQRQLGVPIATHLSETADEVRFTSEADGPLRGFLEGLGLWSDDVASAFGRGRSPATQLVGPLMSGTFLAAHVNAITDLEIEALAQTQTSVVFCPRAWEYFGHESTLGPHRWKDMLAAGINVALGTDSIINLPTAEADRITPWDDARLLFDRGERDAELLLRLITLNGAKALGLDPSMFMLSPSESPRVIAGLAMVELAGLSSDQPALSAAFRSRVPPSLLLPDVPR